MPLSSKKAGKAEPTVPKTGGIRAFFAPRVPVALAPPRDVTEDSVSVVRPPASTSCPTSIPKVFTPAAAATVRPASVATAAAATVPAAAVATAAATASVICTPAAATVHAQFVPCRGTDAAAELFPRASTQAPTVSTATISSVSSSSAALPTSAVVSETSVESPPFDLADDGKDLASHNAIDLAKIGKWEELYILLESRPEVVNVRPAVRDFAVLHQAVHHGRVGAVSTLIQEFGANPELPTKLGKTPLQLAKERGHADVADVLQKHCSGGVAVTPERNLFENSLIHKLTASSAPTSKSHSEVPLDAHFHPASSTSSSSTSASASVVQPISPCPTAASLAPPTTGVAAPFAHTMTSDLLSIAHTAIDLARDASWGKLFVFLKSHPEVVNVRPPVREFSVLHQATYNGCLKIVSALLDDFGADPTQTSKNGQTALEIAQKGGNVAVAEVLRKKLAVVGKPVCPVPKSFKRSSSISWVSSTPPAKKAKMATPAASPAEFKAMLEAASTATPVPIPAVSPGPLPVHAGADLDNIVHAAIDLAKAAKWKDLVALLDANRAIVNMRPDVRDFGIIHQVAWNGCHDMVSVLVETYGADPNQLTKHGQTALDIANKQGQIAVVEKLSHYMGQNLSPGTGLKTPEKVSRSPNPVVVPLPDLTSETIAAAHKLIDLAKDSHWSSAFKMLDAQPELVNVRPHVREFGVLHQAVYLGDAGASRTLLNIYGADPAQLAKNGKYPEEVAKSMGHPELAALLAQKREKLKDQGVEKVVGDDAGGEFEMIQQPDGSWQVMQAASSSLSV